MNQYKRLSMSKVFANRPCPLWQVVRLELDEELTLAQFSLRKARATSPLERADALREVPGDFDLG